MLTVPPPVAAPAARLAAALVVSAAVLLAGGCGTDASVQLAGIGESCSAAMPCTTDAVCLAGRCAQRLPAPDAGPEPDLFEADVADGEDVVGGDTTDVAAEDVVYDIDTNVTGSGGDTGPSADVMRTTVRVGDHSAELQPGADQLSLVAGQGIAADLFVPASGWLLGFDIIAESPDGNIGCGTYRFAHWQPDEDGSVPTEPRFASASFTLEGDEGPQLMELAEEPWIPAGVQRLGLLFDGVCIGSTRQPFIRTDGSGLVGESWVWAQAGAVTTWVDGETLQLDGRWALRVFIGVPVP